MTGDERPHPAVPAWLRAVERDPGATDLVALVRALERLSGSRLGDRDDDDDRHLRLRAEPRLSTAAGRRLQVRTSVDADGSPATVGQTGPGQPPHPPEHPPERQPERPPERQPERPPERPPVRPPVRQPEHPPERQPEHQSEHTPERTPERTPVRQPEHTPESPPERPIVELILHGYGALVGPTTPLPLALAERASGPGAGAERLRAFLDLFHHRLFTHLVRGLARLRAPQASADATLWEAHLLGAAGLGSPTSVIPRSSRRQLLPLLLSASGRPTPALLDQALTICLRPLAGADLRVHTRALAHTTAPRPRSTLSRLGSPRARLQTTTAGDLDAPLLLGAELSVRHGLTIELHLGTGGSVDAFALDQAGHQMIRELVELLAPPGTRWELKVQPKAQLQARLGSARLGRTWLRGSTACSPLRVRGDD